MHMEVRRLLNPVNQKVINVAVTLLRSCPFPIRFLHVLLFFLVSEYVLLVDEYCEVIIVEVFSCELSDWDG